MKFVTTTQIMQPFSYHFTQLDRYGAEIRLLELFPSPDPSADLVCRVFVTTLDRPSNPFQAISYVWGDDTKTSHIYASDGSCNGQTAKLPITRSLLDALRHLRHNNDIVTLWIDQICIDQSNYVEKSHQVQLMGRIYSSAAQVLVWLGPAENRSDELMEAWRVIGQAARDIGIESYFTVEREPLLYRIMNNEDPEDAVTAQYQALSRRTANMFAPLLRDGLITAWFARPWFSRAWVTQEFCLCPETMFVCGFQTMPVELLMLAVQVLHNSMGRYFNIYLSAGMPLELSTQIANEPTMKLFSCRRRWQKFARQEPMATGDQLHSLLRKLYVQHKTQATEYRDRIYSLLGLAVDASVLGITPDYTRRGDEATARILTEAARAMITNSTSGRIDILCLSQFPKTPGLTEHLPSWVPDWRSNLRKSFYEINEATDTHLFTACGSLLDVEPVPSSEPTILGLRGWVVDTIEIVSSGEPWDDLSWDPPRLLGYFSQIDTLFDIAMARQTPGIQSAYPCPARRTEARWRVPIGDLYWTPDHELRRAPQEAERYHRQCLDSLDFSNECTRLTAEEQAQRFNEWGWDEKLRNGELGAFYRMSMEYVIGKKPFMTEKGYLGMGPAGAQTGDVVAVFCGGRIPFVMRPQKGDFKIQTFAFLGEAYCDGIMDGEAAIMDRIQDLFLK